MSIISIITAAVGIIGCVIGVATFVSAMISKAKQDGAMAEKLDQCVVGIDELKKDVKESNRNLNTVMDAHSIDIAELKVQVKSIFKRLDAK